MFAFQSVAVAVRSCACAPLLGCTMGSGGALVAAASWISDFWPPNPAKPSDDGYFSFTSDKTGRVRRGRLLSVSSPLLRCHQYPRRDLLGSFGRTGRVELAKTRWQKRQCFPPARRESWWVIWAPIAEQEIQMGNVMNAQPLENIRVCPLYAYIYLYTLIYI